MAHETASAVGVDTDITCARGYTRGCMRYCSPIPTWQRAHGRLLASLSVTKCLISCDIAHPRRRRPSSSFQLFATLSLAFAGATRRFWKALLYYPGLNIARKDLDLAWFAGFRHSCHHRHRHRGSREHQALLAKAPGPIIGHIASSPRASQRPSQAECQQCAHRPGLD